MKTERKKLTDEINELQTFINHCETARDCGLGLDEETYKKYTDAIDRQRELGEQLEAMPKEWSKNKNQSLRLVFCFLGLGYTGLLRKSADKPPK